MVTKKFYDETAQKELTLFLNKKKRIKLIISEIDTPVIFDEHISLSKNDAIELVRELNYLIKKM